MLKVGDIYYLSDQYGPKFVKIITIGDKDDNWVFFYKSTFLEKIVNTDIDQENSQNLVDKAQLKKWNFEKLIDKFTYNVNFKGCIKICDNVIRDIRDGREIDVVNLINSDPNIYPYMTIDTWSSLLIKNCEYKRICCKRISKQEFRNLKLNKILE